MAKNLLYVKDIISNASTPNSNKSILYIKDLLKTKGFVIKFDPTEGAASEKCDFLYASFVGGNGLNICFVGNLDSQSSTNDGLHFELSHNQSKLAGEKIFGKGSAGSNGCIAASISSALKFINTNNRFAGSISFLIASEDKTSTKNQMQIAMQAITKSNSKIDLAIFTNPVSEVLIGDTIKIGSRGSMNFALSVKASQFHVAYGRASDNPAHQTIKAMQDLVSTPLDTGTKDFDASEFFITSIDTGNKFNSYSPYNVHVRFNVRFNPLHTHESLVALVKKVLDLHIKKYELKYQFCSEPYIQNSGELVQKFTDVISKNIGFSAKLSTYGRVSDARFIKDYSQVVECGLLRHKGAVQVNEFVTVSDLEKLIDLYYYSLKEFLI